MTAVSPTCGRFISKRRGLGILGLVTGHTAIHELNFRLAPRTLQAIGSWRHVFRWFIPSQPNDLSVRSPEHHRRTDLRWRLGSKIPRYPATPALAAIRPDGGAWVSTTTMQGTPEAGGLLSTYKARAIGWLGAVDAPAAGPGAGVHHVETRDTHQWRAPGDAGGHPPCKS